MAITIYHNPRCTKSRQTLQLLRDQNIEPNIIEYLKTPPDADTLQELLNKLGLSARELMRQKETLYKELALDNEALTESQLIAAMHANPSLIERPIVVNNSQAVIGRPPENVLEIL